MRKITQGFYTGSFSIHVRTTSSPQKHLFGSFFNNSSNPYKECSKNPLEDFPKARTPSCFTQLVRYPTHKPSRNQIDQKNEKIRIAAEKERITQSFFTNWKP